ncbi:hypothetical protein Esti_004799 [Eimeria stiedai]
MAGWGSHRGTVFKGCRKAAPGETTVGYDPSSDHEWLVTEVELWIFKNLWSKWSSIARRHTATSSSLLETFSAQLSGYGTSQALVGAVLQEYQRVKRAKAKTLQPAAAATAAAAAAPAAVDDSSLVPDDLSKWTAEDALELVKTFVKIRFPFVLVLNKCDAGGDVDKNVMKLATKFPGQPLVLTSALAECFLQNLQQQGMLYYDPGSGCAYHKEEASGPGSCRLQAEQLDAIRALKPIDSKALQRLEKVRDLMLFRHGGTGVAEAIRIAVEVQGQRLPVYPVKTLQLSTPDKKGRGPFFECLLVKKGTTVGDLASILHPAIAKNFLFAELPDGRRVGEQEVLTTDCNILRITTDKGIGYVNWEDKSLPLSSARVRFMLRLAKDKQMLAQKALIVQLRKRATEGLKHCADEDIQESF